MLPESDSNHPVDPRIIDIMLDGFKRLQEGQVQLASSIVGKDVYHDHKETCRANFTEVFERVLDIESALSEQGVSLARAENNVLDRARAEDGKLLEAIDNRMAAMDEKIEATQRDIRSIKEYFVILSFSRCSLNWIWKHKVGAAVAFGVASAWVFIIDSLSRVGCGLIK
jgi:hypothetical protein